MIYIPRYYVYMELGSQEGFTRRIHKKIMQNYARRYMEVEE